MNKESVEIINRLRAILQDSWVNILALHGLNEIKIINDLGVKL
jgi:hypothetical protein